MILSLGFFITMVHADKYMRNQLAFKKTKTWPDKVLKKRSFDKYFSTMRRPVLGSLRGPGPRGVLNVSSKM